MRVLVIDDEPDVLLLCRVNLGHAGCEVAEASDGRQGLDEARGTQPDAVVLDLMLPGVDGFRVLDELASDPRTERIPVLVLTAKAQQEDEERCARLGADAFLTKPFSPEALVEAVTTLASADREQVLRRRKKARRELERA